MLFVLFASGGEGRAVKVGEWQIVVPGLRLQFEEIVAHDLESGRSVPRPEMDLFVQL